MCIAGRRAAGILRVFQEGHKRVLEPIRRVRLARTVLRHANIRENRSPSLGKIRVKLPHQRSPLAEKFEDRSQEEPETWRLAKNV